MLLLALITTMLLTSTFLSQSNSITPFMFCRHTNTRVINEYTFLQLLRLIVPAYIISILVDN